MALVASFAVGRLIMTDHPGAQDGGSGQADGPTALPASVRSRFAGESSARYISAASLLDDLQPGGATLTWPPRDKPSFRSCGRYVVSLGTEAIPGVRLADVHVQEEAMTVVGPRGPVLVGGLLLG
jgi:hypothetical protein